MKFRILVLKDPHAEARGFSLKGIKVPLRDWCPVHWNEDVATFEGKKLMNGRYDRFWRLRVEDLVLARPALERFLRKADHLLVPVEFCDVSPVEHEEEMWSSWG